MFIAFHLYSLLWMLQMLLLLGLPRRMADGQGRWVSVFSMLLLNSGWRFIGIFMLS